MNWKPGLAAVLLGVGAAASAQGASNSAAGQTAAQRFERGVGEAKSLMMAEPAEALDQARAAARAAALLDNPRARALGLAQARWLEGEALTRINRPDKAAPILADALRMVVSLAPRSKLHGDLLLAGATSDWAMGRVQVALAGFQAAYRIFGALGEARAQAKALQCIGSIYFDARDYPRMLKYYQQSAETYAGDPALTIAAYNNVGDALKEMRRFREAVANYQRALLVTHRIDSPLLEVRVLTNIASAQYLSGALGRADATANRGLARARGRDTGWEPFLWGVKAQVAHARGDLVAAARYLERTFAGIDPAATPLIYRDFHATAYKLYQALGRDRLALDHMAAFKRLDDEARDVAASTNSALMAARFDFANQELRIAKLKAGQLQRDIALARSKARLHATMLWGVLGTALLVVTATLLALFSIRRSRNEVRQANRTLSAVNVDLEKALTAKTRFLATTSHEIRTPLNGILGMTQVMLGDPGLTSRQRERIRLVNDAGETMKALVDDILDLAKMETGKLVIECSEFEPRPLLEGVARLWADQAAIKGLKVTADLKGCPDRLIGDARRLRQIVFNLMSNAVKFTEIGSVELSAGVEEGMLVLRVTDTGIGIPRDQFDAVFNSFYQVDGGIARRYGGTGLGLAICRDITRAMDGDVVVESELGRGSAFTVRLPLMLPSATSSALRTAAPAAWPVALADATVLVVENNPLTRSIIAAALAKRVGQVTSASGLDVRGCLERQHFHHVVLDLDTLGTDDKAAELLAWLAYGASGGHSAVTLLVADAARAEAFGANRSFGIVQLLLRPITPANLLAAIERAHLQVQATRPQQPTAPASGQPASVAA